MKKSQVIFFVFYIFITSCQSTANHSIEKTEDVEVTSGDRIVNLAIEAHGGKKYDEANFQFKFRGKQYQFENFGKSYRYSREQILDGDTIVDILNGQEFQRQVNKKPVSVNELDAFKYSESINSVIYFATLPHKLGDEAVIKKYLGQTRIFDKLYNIIKVSFHEEGGGKDHKDVFYYWFNAETNQMDYLAYQYATNGGGVRFRSSYGKRVVGGIIFQDYINFSAPIGIDLVDLPKLFEHNSLEELSRIENKNIKIMNFQYVE